jgi:phosphoribosylaminoimidazole-succinocarboxamide synthase
VSGSPEAAAEAETAPMLDSPAEGVRARRLASGKVRDIYELPGDRLLIVATDRISAFDVVLPQGIPGKGEVLTRLSAYWFELTRAVVPNAFVAVLDASNAAALGVDADAAFHGRSIVMRRADPLPVECVVRGFLAGSGWADYERTGAVSGIELPEGLRRADRLFEPIFTPSTKAPPTVGQDGQDGQGGHDEPIDFARMQELVGAERAEAMRLRSLALYRYGALRAAERGILVADSKFEFGLLDGEPVLIDEVLTPDSSRFWPADRYEPGREQESFDKQPVRDWLAARDWDRTPPAPELPAEVVRATSARYRRAYELITGTLLDGDPLPAAGPGGPA